MITRLIARSKKDTGRKKNKNKQTNKKNVKKRKERKKGGKIKVKEIDPHCNKIQ